MLHLIAYDITDDRRLRRIARVCEDYGMRVEKSVFECDLDNETFKVFWTKLTGLTDETDSVVDYPIGMIGRKHIKTLGRAASIKPELIFVS